ncbi:MAG: hypothetical protein K2H72_03175 [Muribaculaceae bacterium]|nr:hypothetical protein [Muribaculaceae bacterium]
MKKILLFLAIIMPMIMFAQTEVPTPVQEDDEITTYALILGINKNVLGIGNKISVQIDFGEEKNFWGNDGRDILVDDNGKDIKFNSMVDALNFMGARGWEFENAYAITVGNQHVYHWLISKKIKAGENARGDLQQKRDKKKKKSDRNSKVYDPLYD